MPSKRVEVRIGTSGWHYKHWVGPYYREAIRQPEMLPRYLEDFDTVEINNTFYHLPKRETFAAWRANTPRGFLFAVKGSRFLTHMKKLKDPEEGIARFFDGVEALGPRTGPILWQLPPHWKKNAWRLDAFLEALPRGYRYAFELRDPTWMDDEIYDVLRRHRAAFCIYELAGYHSPILTTTDFVYVRLHGPTLQKYQGSYKNATLARWAERIRAWRDERRSVYVYFDNDQAAYAVINAIALKAMVQDEVQSSRVQSSKK